MKNILIFTTWSYKEGLIQTYTLPYLDLILKHLPPNSQVYLQTLEKEPLPESEHQKIRKSLLEKNIHWLPLSYHKPGLKAILTWGWFVMKWTFMSGQKNISHIHAFAPPAGVPAYLVSTLSGKPLIMDSFEPHAEAMVENKTWQPNSLKFSFLKFMEKAEASKASHIIATSEGMKQYINEKLGTSPNRFHVKPACVDLNKFSLNKIKNKQLAEKYNLTGKVTCVYAGKFGGIYLEDEVFDFFKIAEKYWKGKFRALLLTPTPYAKIEKWISNSGLNNETVIYASHIPHAQIASYIGLADFAINPVKPVPSKRYCTSIKDGEYWAMGLPVVITKGISDDSGIIRENKIGYVLNELSAKEYMNAVRCIDQLITNNKDHHLNNSIRNIAEKQRNFNVADDIYKEIYG